MLKRIHSNRDPRDTVFTELNKEFRPYLHSSSELLKRSTERHPRSLLYLMIICIGVSIVLSFFVLKPKNRAKTKTKSVIVAPAINGFDQLLETGQKLRETITLKRVIDSLSEKKDLSPADSLKLEFALDRLQTLNRSFAMPKDSTPHLTHH